MRRCNVLHPANVNRVVHVILLVDIGRNDRHNHFESQGGHRESVISLPFSRLAIDCNPVNPVWRSLTQTLPLLFDSDF